MAGASEELPPLVQELIAQYDDARSRPEFERFADAQERALRDAAKRGQQVVEEAMKRVASATRKGQKKVTDETKKGADDQVRATKAGLDREDALFKAHIKKHLADNAEANAKRLQEQKAADTNALENKRQFNRLSLQAQEDYNKRRRQRERKADWDANEDHKHANDKQLELVRGQVKKVLEDQAQGNRHRLENHRQANRKELALVQGQVKKVLETQAQGNRHKLENHRAANRKELEADRAANRETITNLNNAVRQEMQKRSAADKRKLTDQQAALRRQQTILEAGLKSQLSAQEAAQTRSINAHKAMWSIVRALTETGSRFLSSVTQSALRSMGSAVGIGLSRITGIYKREGNQQEGALRSSFAEQEAITRRAMVRQQGVVQGFQARNAAVTQGGAGGGPIGALMSVRNMLLGAGAFISARAIFGPIMDYQQTKIAFEGILQSSTAAEAMLQQLQNFAKVTPFTFAGIADSAKQLLAVGYAAEDVIPMMTTLGDTAAGLGLGEEAISGVIRALGQMKGKGKASAEEMNQISEQLPGFSAIGAVADSMGITVAEAFDQMKAGAIPADLAIQAILEGMREMPGAAGAMERQSRTLTGRLSTLKDTIQILLVKAMEPFVGSMSNAIGMLTTFLDNLFNAGGVFRIVRSALLGLAIALGSMLAYQGVVLMLDGIKLALIAIAQNPAVVVFTGLVVAMTMLYRHVPAVTEVVNDLRDAFMEFFTGTREALGLLMDGDFPAFFDRMQTIGEDLLAALAPSVNVIRDFFTEAFNTAADWIEGGGMGDLWDTITETISNAATAIAESPAAEWLVDFGKATWQKWQEWLDQGGLGDLAESMKLRILDALVKVKEGIEAIDWDRLLKPALVIAAAAVASLLLGIPVWIVVAGVAAVVAYSKSPRLRSGLREAFDNIGEWIGRKWDKVTAKIDWTSVVVGALAAIESNTAKITAVIVKFIQSDAFVNAMVTVALALGAVLGAVVVGVIDGIIQATIDSWNSGDGILGRGFVTQVWEDMILDSLHNMNIDGADIWAALLDSLTGLGFLGMLFRALIWDPGWSLTADWWRTAFNNGQLGPTGLADAITGMDWSGAWNRVWGAITAPFHEQVHGIITGIWTEIKTEFMIFTELGGMIVRAILKGLEMGNDFTFSIVNGIIDAINRIIDSINDGLEFDIGIGPVRRHVDAPDIGHIPHMATGGIVTKPTVALIGEAGPEAVIPLSQGMGQIPLSIVFDTSAIAAQVAGVAAILAPMGDRISQATMPGLTAWVAAVNLLLAGMSNDFKDWGKTMVTMAATIGATIGTAMGDALREGRSDVTRIVRGYGRNLAGALNPLLAAIGEQPVRMEFARGGIAEPYQGAQVHVFNEGRRGRGSSHGEAYIPFDPANKPRSQALATETVRRLGGDVQWYAKGGLSPEAIARGKNFARAQDGKPYKWGAVGPSAYDCSGLASAIINAVRGQDPYHRLFTSGSLVAGASAGLLPGLGQVSVGARSGSPGHVSTTIAGLNAESTGDHVRIGAAARSAADFPSRWHLGSGVFIGPDGTTYPLPKVPGVGHGDFGRLGKGWMRFVKRKAQSFVDANTYTGIAFGAPESGVPSGMQVGDGSPDVMRAIRRAMAIVGVPSSWLGPLLTLIGRESGFNPRAYNAILGASGLMQTIPSTFAANALPGYGGIFDPLANVIAGLRYILGRYGSIFNVGQATAAHPTRGYSYGGVVDREGMYRLAEGNKREVVLPLENRGRLMELLRRTGLADTIALAAAGPIDMGSVRADSATSRSAPSIGSVIGELNVHSNAIDPMTVADITTRKVDRQVRDVLTGVGV